MTPVPRGWLAALLDRLLAWARGLPAESSSYTVENLRIPVEDGLELTADLYRPIGVKPVGTLLVRSPYGIGLPLSFDTARAFAARGYQVLISSCRGASGSGGEFVPGANEAADGHATVVWMRQQSWYTGSFATIGTSYLGYTQWALLSDPPEDMKAAVINTGPHDFSDFIWGTGALSSNVIAWADMMTRMGKVGLLSLIIYLRRQDRLLRPVINGVPLLSTIDSYFQNSTPGWLRRDINHPDRGDAFWKPMQQQEAIERADIPIFLVTGWNDLIRPQVMHQYYRLLERGCNVALTVGPWTHIDAGGRSTSSEAFTWLEQHFAHRSGRTRPSPVRAFITGVKEWRSLPRWPPATKVKELFLGPSKSLSQDVPPAETPDTVFKFDPADPTPSIGAPLLFDNGWTDEDTALGSRSDVAIFLTEPLTQDLEVCGRPSVELYHSSNHPYVDVLVLLSEVDRKGKSRSLTERFVRLDSTRSSGPLKLEMFDIGHVFCKGTRIRLLVAGGSHPRYIRNLGTGESQATGAKLAPAWHTIQHNAHAASKLVLPVTLSVEALR